MHSDAPQKRPTRRVCTTPSWLGSLRFAAFISLWLQASANMFHWVALPGNPDNSMSLHSPVHYRLGEADNPGPALSSCGVEPVMETHDLLRIGTTNPAGLRRKEHVAIDLGPGTWNFSETHLSDQTAPTTKRRLRYLARQRGRDVRVHTGAAVPLRHNSTWAGSWSGVLTLSDCASQQLQIPMPAQCWDSGRILCTRHIANGISLLVTCVYGFPRGPTFPKALGLTDQLLEPLTTEIVLGGRGPRFICGDFNATPGQSPTLQAFTAWERLGWRNLQDFAAECLGWAKLPTCKGKTERDLIYASPEALSLIQGISISEDFAEHATLAATLAVPKQLLRLQRWPRPQHIPWDQVDAAWTPSAPATPPGSGSSATYATLWTQLEASLDGHISSQPGRSLTRGQQGRAKRVTPHPATFQQSFARPSRQGEVRLHSDLTGRSVQQWFRQLRRLQSMKQALSANSSTPQAQIYRAELWTAICHAKGFRSGRPTWWEYHRAHGRHLANFAWPSCIPSSVMMDCIFEAFKECFARFEAWHLRQRSRCLQTKHDQTMKSLFQELKPPAREQASLLIVGSQHEVQGRPDGPTLHPASPGTGTCLWSIGSTSSLPSASLPEDLQPGQTLTCTQVLSGPHEVHDAILAHWVQHWNNRVTPSDSD